MVSESRTLSNPTSLPRQSRARGFYENLVTHYSLYGDDTPRYFSTYDGHHKRSIRKLADMGFVAFWEDDEDSRKVWCAALPREK